MQEPEYVVSFYVATCGLNGNNLGSDEKEIILLVYIILNGLNGQIVGTKQILVRPDGSLVRTCTNSTPTDPGTTSVTQDVKPFEGSNLNNGNIYNITNKSKTLSAPLMNNSSSTNMTNIVTCSTNSPVPSVTKEVFSSVPISDIQDLGKPLSEAIEDFTHYLRSLSISEANISLVTDGQLPLRQCLHREACAKDIILPEMYNKFCDLRKEFQKFKSGDLSKALVPVKDINKMLQIPVKPLPQSIEEIILELNVMSFDIDGFYSKESREMAAVVQNMIQSGYRFIPNEEITLVLEPGICSIDDQVDGNCIVRARGLPWQSSDEDIAKFFRGLNVAKGGVALCLSPLGRRNGEALIRFVSQEHRDMALKRHKHHIGPRYIEVYRATGEDFLSVAGGASNEAQTFLSKGAQVIIRMRGLPYDCTAKQVLEFFTTGENPCDVLDGTEGVLFVKKPDGRATGDAFVLFANERDAPKALGRHRESIGQRYIELFRSTTAEVQQVLNRSMDPKLYEPAHNPAPLIAQLPTVPLSLLPQHLITSGTMKNCVRLRGLPYEALVEHILHFLDDFAKHIIYQGVHMVINAQGQPSGEAFIQMDSEESARLCAQRKHNQFMVFGKKYRYIEVFQCSGDDMNMVLNGGLQAPLAAPSHPSAAAGKHTPLLPSGASVFTTPFGSFSSFGAVAPIISTSNPRMNNFGTTPAHTAHPPGATAFYTQPFVYWPYISPPLSPTTYFTQTTHSANTCSANSGPNSSHRAMLSMEVVNPTYGAHPNSKMNNGIIFKTNKSGSSVSLVTAKKYSSAVPITIGANYSTNLSFNSVLYHHQQAPPPAQAVNQHAFLCNSVAPPAIAANLTSTNTQTLILPSQTSIPIFPPSTFTPLTSIPVVQHPEILPALDISQSNNNRSHSSKNSSKLNATTAVFSAGNSNTVNVTSKTLVTNQCVELFIS